MSRYGMLSREDMLELTRRMTPTRTCFDRVAGSYRDEDGIEDGSFNIHFLKLTDKEKADNLKIAKAIPFAETKVQLKSYDFPVDSDRSVQMSRMLWAIKDSGLKNDALLENLYELIGDSYSSEGDYGIFIFHGVYDVPVKGKDKEWLEGSESVYDFIICAICPVTGDYEAGIPAWGFLYPSFVNRCEDRDHIAVYNRDPQNEDIGFLNMLGLL
jgi:hypothetical protein